MGDVSHQIAADHLGLLKPGRHAVESNRDPPVFILRGNGSLNTVLALTETLDGGDEFAQGRSEPPRYPVGRPRESRTKSTVPPPSKMMIDVGVPIRSLVRFATSVS